MSFVTLKSPYRVPADFSAAFAANGGAIIFEVA
jgi:hypothetical protein